MILLIAVLLYFLLSLSGWTGVVFLLCASALEALEIWGLRRWSKRLNRERPAQGPQDELIGLVGDVVTPCRPRGSVRVRGELWEAYCPGGAEQGSEVRVESVDALTLTVAPRG